MNRLLLAALLAAILLVGSSRADLPTDGKTMAHFASVEEGRKILTTKDDFISRLSPFDRSARMKVARAVSEPEFLDFVGKNVAAWTPGETEAVEAAIKKIQPRLREFALPLPPIVEFIKTTGAEEGGAAYTRANAIVLPQSEFAKKDGDLAKLICHELFHVLSRQNPALRDKLYAVIGFMKCDEIAFPPDLKTRKITNPDAPRNDHFIALKAGGEECLAVPILFSTSETYDTKRGGEFFNYLSFKFLITARRASSHQLEPKMENGERKLVPPKAVSGFFEQVGKNTNYIIHPEEILADNFALLVLGEHNVPSPEILQKMKAVLEH